MKILDNLFKKINKRKKLNNIHNIIIFINLQQAQIWIKFKLQSVIWINKEIQWLKSQNGVILLVYKIVMF